MNIKKVLHPDNNEASPLEFALLPVGIVVLIAMIAKGFHIQFDLLHAILTGYLIHLQREAVVKVIEPFILQTFPDKTEIEKNDKANKSVDEDEVKSSKK